MKKILTLLLVLVLCMSVFVACKNNNDDPTPDPTPDVTYDAQGAADYLEGMYKEEITGNKAADFTVVPQVKVGTVTYPVTWTVDTDKVTVEVSEDGKTVTVNVPEKSDEDFSYKLTATITAGDGTTASVVFDLNVVKYGVNTHEEYMNAKKDDELTVEGIVVAMNSVKMGNKRNHLFLADASVDGGYYCYNLAVDPAELGIEVGMTVSVTAKMSPYSGMQELSGGTPVIVDKTIKTVAPLDITTQFAAKENLAKYVGLAVTIKGVDIGAQDLAEASSQYLYFYLGDAEGYVRTYVTDFPAGMLVADDKATIDADHAAHFGYKADVTGILVLYGTEHPYLIPMSVTPFTNYEEVTKTPEEKVAAELAGVTLDASLSADKVIDLLLVGQYYNDVTLEWTTTDETGAAVIADGKLTLTVPDEAITVTITVKAKCGEVSDTKTLTVKLSKTITALGEASAIGAAKEHNTYTAEKYIVGGIILEVETGKYGNMTIKDETGNTLYVYGTYIDGTKYGEFEGDKPVVGDYVVIIGVLGQYNDKAQMKNGDITSFVHAGSIKDAVDAGAAQDHNTYTENKFLVTGVIESIANDKYGNLTIKDAEGNSIYVYGLYNQTGVRYDALTVKPVAGDTITILGVAGKYNDTVQLKNATLVAHTAATTEEPECEHTYENGVCTKCGEADPDYVAPGAPTTGEVVFDFGANGTAGTHDDGDDIGASKNYTSGNYTLAITGATKVYDGGFDKAGNSILKFGTSSVAGTITFVVPDEVTSVVIHAARYKSYADNNIIVVNGTNYTLTKNSDDGEYEAITVDTTTNKTVTVASSTSAAKPRCVINTIVFVIGEGSGETPDPTPDPEPECEHNYVDGVCTKCGENDPTYVPPVVGPVYNAITDLATLKTGDKILIGAPAYGKLLSMVKVSTYYNAGVDYTATDFSKVTNDEIFVVTVNEDGTYSFTSVSGKVLAMAASNSSLNDTGANTTWNVTAGDAGIFFVKNVGRGNALEWYNSKNNWSTYTLKETDTQFQMSFYLVEAAAGGETPAPHEHEFVNGECACGEKDPNYVPPHEHEFVNGECACGEKDPNYVAPEQPVVSGGSADFDTIVPKNANGDSGYTSTYTTTNGWVTEYSAIQTGGATVLNPQFPVIGETNADKAVCLNGKTTATGKVTSPTLTGGISQLTLTYTKMFTDTKLSVTITVTDVATGTKYTHDITVELPKDEKYVVYTDVWTLETPVTGDFTIEIVNNCPSASTSNKDRLTILDLTWVGVAE